MQVSIVRKANTVSDFRIDAECYQEKYLLAERKLSHLKHTLLGDEVAKFCKGIFDIKAECYSEAGIPFVRIGDLKDCVIDVSNIIYIPEAEHLKNHKTALKKDDVILSKTAYPAASLVDLDECNTSQDTIAIKLKEKAQIKSKYLVIFLNSKFGYPQMERWFTGNIQMHLNLSDSRNIKIPLLSQAIQEAVESSFSNAIQLKNQSIREFQIAQRLVLSELGLLDWQPKHDLSFVRYYSDTRQAGRYDADYFQPKYDEIAKAIKSYTGGYSFIRDEFRQNKSTFIVDDKKTYHYVEIGSINVSSGEVVTNEVAGSELPANAKRLLRKNDVVISKVRTYRGAITIIDQDGCVGSGAFTVLHEKGRINKETLLAFLHSKPLLAWSLKPNTGTSYPVIVDDDILNLPIPIFREKAQAQIQQKVSESFILRKQSKLLLECAKKAVEMAIEKNEKTAVNWMKQQAEKLKI